MQKLKFFLGSPDEITQSFEEWQTANPNVNIKGAQQAISTLPLPGRPAEGIVPAGMESRMSIQIQTFLCLMVIYEDLSSNPE